MDKYIILYLFATKKTSKRVVCIKPVTGGEVKKRLDLIN